MKRPQLSLRDLFWLMLVAAIAVGWWVDHASAVNELRLLKMHWPSGPPPERSEPSAESLERGKLMKELHELSDAQLSDRLGEILDRGRHGRGPEYEPCLSEMVRRGMRDALQEHYDQLMSRKEKLLEIPLFPENRELLIALRRTQGKPDPLKSHFELWRPEARGNSPSISLIQIIMENDDVDKESVFFSHGDHDDRWQIKLTNATGQRVPDSNVVPYPFEERGGFRYGSMGPIKFGERLNVHYLDARRYVEAPRPGEYQLQVFHSGGSIARESNFEGLIVLKSEPVNVIVE